METKRYHELVRYQGFEFGNHRMDVTVCVEVRKAYLYTSSGRSLELVGPMTSSLPPELWLNIMALAVIDDPESGLFDTKWDYSPDDRMWQGSLQLASTEMTAQSRRTRCVITSVSRSWRVMGRRFLYENVRVDLDRAVPSAVITRILERNTAIVEEVGSDSAPTAVSVGWWVKRLVICSSQIVAGNFDQLLRLLGACFNVKILLFSVNDYEPSCLSKLSQIIQARFSHSLRHMSICKRLGFNDSNTLYGFPDLPNVPLHSLSLTMDFNTTLQWNDALCSGAFASLSMFEIVITGRTADFTFPHSRFPSLQYLFVNGLDRDHFELLLPFMKLNGPNLLGVRFETRHSYLDLSPFLEHTTSLKQLIMDDTDLVALSSSSTDHPICSSVTHIGLVGIDYYRIEDTQRIAKGLDRILTRRWFSNLQTVRILEPYTPEYLERTWAQSIAITAKHGVRLEDYRQTLLSDIHLYPRE